MKYSNTPISHATDMHIGDFFLQAKSYWKYYIVIGFLCLFVAIIYIAATESQYKFYSSVKLVTDQDGLSSEIKSLQSSAIGSVLGGKSSGVNTDDEVLVMQSHTVMGKVIKDLGLQVDIKRETGLLGETTIYKDSPLNFNFSEGYLDLLKTPITMKIELNGTRMNLEYELYGQDKRVLKDISQNYILSLPGGSLKFSPKMSALGNQCKLDVSIYPLNYLYDKLLDDISMKPADAASDVVNLSWKNSNLEKGKEVLNEIMKNYNEYSRSVKLMTTDVNTSFAREKLATVSLELDSIENKIKLYKERNEIPDMGLYGGAVFSGSEGVKSKILELQTQSKLLDYVLDYVKNSHNQYKILPSLQYGGDVIGAYNQLMFQRMKLLQGAEQDNPAVVMIDNQLREERKVLIKTLQAAQNSLGITLRDAGGEDALLQSKVNSLPAQAQEFVSLERQQKIKQSMYLFLLQKIQEKEIANSPDEMASRVLDSAYASWKPMYPKKIIVLLIAFILSFVLTIIVVTIKSIIMNKYVDLDYLNEMLKYPLWGDFSDVNSFLKLRHQVYSPQKESLSLLVTSSSDHEGKSFFAYQIAKSLSETQKKVILLNIDYKTPAEYYKSAPSEKQVITDTFTSMTLGNINKNNENSILYTSQTKEILEELKRDYDYIVIDSPSLDDSTLAYDAGYLVDYTFYLVRKGFTRKNKIRKINQFIDSSMLPQVSVVYNSTLRKS